MMFHLYGKWKVSCARPNSKIVKLLNNKIVSVNKKGTTLSVRGNKEKLNFVIEGAMLIIKYMTDEQKLSYSIINIKDNVPTIKFYEDELLNTEVFFRQLSWW